jgi:hypothetical protein
MHNSLKQVGPLEGIDGPVLRVVHVNIPAVLGKEGVSQRPAGPVERIAVAVFESLEADVDVNGGGAARLREGERHHRLPHREGSSEREERMGNDNIWYFIQHCLICRPSDSTVLEDAAWDRPQAMICTVYKVWV